MRKALRELVKVVILTIVTELMKKYLSRAGDLISNIRKSG